MDGATQHLPKTFNVSNTKKRLISQLIFELEIRIMHMVLIVS